METAAELRLSAARPLLSAASSLASGRWSKVGLSASSDPSSRLPLAASNSAGLCCAAEGDVFTSRYTSIGSPFPPHLLATLHPLHSTAIHSVSDSDLHASTSSSYPLHRSLRCVTSFQVARWPLHRCACDRCSLPSSSLSPPPLSCARPRSSRSPLACLADVDPVERLSLRHLPSAFASPSPFPPLCYCASHLT